MADQNIRFRLSADDKASSIFKRARAELAGMRKEGAALRSVFTALAPSLIGAFTAAGIVSFARSVNDGLLKLKDLSEATGASIENVSGLENVARAAGSSIDDVSRVLIKFNAALKDSTKTKELGAAFKAMGLDVEKLKALDPAEALLQTATAMDRFADDGNKGRLSMELFNKSIDVAAPLLKELAEAGKLNGTVLTEQVIQADKFNKELAKISNFATDAGRALAGPLVESINRTIELFREGAKAGKGFFQTLRDEQLKLLGFGGGKDGIGELQRKLAQIDEALANPQLPEIMRAGFLEKRAQAAAELAERMKDVKSAFLVGDKDRTPVALPKPSLPGTPPDAEAARKAAAQRLKDAEYVARQLLEIEEQTAKDAAEAWGYWEKQQLDADRERAEARKLQWQQVFEFIDAEQERAIEDGQAMLQGLAADSQKVGQDLALVFTSAASNALTHWQGVRNLLQGILADVAQIAVKATITDPLSKYLGSALQGFSFGNLLGFRAEGGPVSAGRPYVVGERGPELFVPRSGGTVLPNGAGAGGTTIINNVAAGVTRGEMLSALQMAMRSTEASILGRLQRDRVYA